MSNIGDVLGKVFIIIPTTGLVALMGTSQPLQAQQAQNEDKPARFAVTVGLNASTNLGESALSPVLGGVLRVGNSRIKIENEATFSPSNKIESGKGFYLTDDIDVLIPLGERTLMIDLGTRYTHRNGGNWTKDTLSLKAGLGKELITRGIRQEWRAAYRKAIAETFPNRTQGLTFLYRGYYDVKGKTLLLEYDGVLLRYTQARMDRTGYDRRNGFSSKFSVGIAHLK